VFHSFYSFYPSVLLIGRNQKSILLDKIRKLDAGLESVEQCFMSKIGLLDTIAAWFASPLIE